MKFNANKHSSKERKQTKFELYQPIDKSMFWKMLRSELIQWRLNKTPIWNIPKRNRLIKKLFAKIDGNPLCCLSPIYAQQGNNTYIGKNFYCGYGCTFLDHAEIHIGDNVMLAPHVSLITVKHPVIPEQRIVRPMPNTFEPDGRGEFELIAPMKIGNNVWVATGSIICPGVTIGDNANIGAGSVVTKDIPPNVIAFGTPCKVIRKITEEDRVNEDFSR